jgi:hypothetical protein
VAVREGVDVPGKLLKGKTASDKLTYSKWCLGVNVWGFFNIEQELIIV